MLSTPRYRSPAGTRYGGGGGYNMTLSFPPFTPGVKWLIILNVTIYFLISFAGILFPELTRFFVETFALLPAQVIHGYVWQLVTYAFLHAGIGHILINMYMLWMFGAQLEVDRGTNRFLEFYFFCVLGASLLTTAVAFTGFMGVSPYTATVGASGGVYGLLLAFGMLNGDREIILFPLPFRIKAKYMAVITVLIVLASTLQPGPTGIAYMAHLGGLLFGFLYLKFLPRSGVTGSFSKRYFGLRNSYYRWKRRRAGKKFEVYMRKHDPDKFFDEYGNFRGHEKSDRDNDDSGPRMVN